MINKKIFTKIVSTKMFPHQKTRQTGVAVVKWRAEVVTGRSREGGRGCNSIDLPLPPFFSDWLAQLFTIKGTRELQLLGHICFVSRNQTLAHCGVGCEKCGSGNDWIDPPPFYNCRPHSLTLLLTVTVKCHFNTRGSTCWLPSGDIAWIYIIYIQSYLFASTEPVLQIMTCA